MCVYLCDFTYALEKNVCSAVVKFVSIEFFIVFPYYIFDVYRVCTGHHSFNPDHSLARLTVLQVASKSHLAFTGMGGGVVTLFSVVSGWGREVIV